MRTRHSLNLLAAIVLIVLSACSAKPAPVPAAPPVTASAEAPVQAPASSQPTAAPLPTPTRAPLPPTVVSVTPDRGEEADPGRARGRDLRPADGPGRDRRGVRHRAEDGGPGEGARQRAELHAGQAVASAGPSIGLRWPRARPAPGAAASTADLLQIRHRRLPGSDEHPARRRRGQRERGQHHHGRVQPAGRAAWSAHATWRACPSR